MMTSEMTFVCFGIICLLNRYVTSTSTPPLPESIAHTSAVDQTVLLNPTATLYAVQASRYMAINSGCGGNLTNHTGQLTHPTYPQSIERPCACTWRINLDPGTRISMLFNYVNLKGDCENNFLEVWEMSSSGSRTMLKRSCGYLDKPVRLVTNTNEIEVGFQSNSSISGGGFLVTYSKFSECNQTFANNTALIQSPYYPDDYPLNLQCAYSIKVPADYQISLSLEFLDLTYSVNCTEDILEVWDGTIGGSAVIGRYCGYIFSQWLRSKGNELSLRFTSDKMNTRRGFRVRYYAIKSDCNSTVNLTKGFIATPNQHGSTCSWTINSPPGHVISIRFDRFFLKLSEDCSRDYLVIKDDDQSEVGRYCGYQKGELVYSNTNSVTLEYMSKTVDDNHGFQVYYEALMRPESRGYLNKTRGYFQSPLYPNNYPSNAKHTWQIEQLSGYVIDLVFDDFQLEFSVNCTQDYLEVFDGADNSSASLGKYCGVKKSSDHVTTSGNLMYLEFASNSRRRAKGFRVSYTGIKSDCPKNFTNASGIIESPNYPDFYPKNYDCQWHISYEVGYQVYLTLTYFDLVYTSKCSGDYVVITGVTGEKEGQPERLCGYIVKRYPLVSKENKLVIKFHSDSQDASRGFVLNYKVDGTGYPPTPRSPTSDEIEQAVKIEFYNITKSQWITNKDIAFKKLIANATNVYCQGENLSKCRLLSNERQRRSTEAPLFTMGSIHLAPGFPNTGDASGLVVVFYALYSSGMKVDSTWMSPALSQDALLDAVRNSQDYIVLSFGSSIKSISAYSNVNSTTLPPVAISQRNLLAIILPIVCGFVVIVGVIAVCLYWRKKNHGKFMVKRCVTPIEFVDKNDEIKLEKVQTSEAVPARRRASTLKLVDLDG